jgi:thiamine-monophosphate kinase
MNDRLDEDSIIKLFKNYFTNEFDDDIGLIKYKKSKYVVTIDTFVRSSDAPKNMDPYYMGWKAGLSSLSDVYIKGSSPLGALISIGLPSDINKKYVNNLARGLYDILNKYSVNVLKWDTNYSKELFISVALIGKPGKVIPWRSNMKVGDCIFVSDYFGLEALGLNILLNKIELDDPAIRESAIRRFYKPDPDLKKYSRIVNMYRVSASIDSSDGLARSLWLLSKRSNKKIRLQRIPIHPLLLKSGLPKNKMLEFVLYGGEEYIGIFAVPRNLSYNLTKEGFIKIGEVVENNVGVYNDKNQLIEDRGFIHLF